MINYVYDIWMEGKNWKILFDAQKIVGATGNIW